MRTGIVVVAFAIVSGPATAQQMDPRRGPPGCIPVSTRTMELGCYIMADTPLGKLAGTTHYWHLDIYPDVQAAHAAKGPTSTVVESLGKVWLFTIADKEWRSSHGKHVAV